MKIIPLSLGFNKSNIKNAYKYPKYTINKLPDDEFIFEFDHNAFDQVKVTIVPINCDHMVLWLVEATGKNDSIFSGLLSGVNDNSGLWFVEVLGDKNNNCKIVLDINQEKGLVKKGIFKKWFSLITDLEDHDNLIKISIKGL
jgi:hypothetical protein